MKENIKDKLAYLTEQGIKGNLVAGKVPVIPINYDMYLPERFGKYVDIGGHLNTIKTVIEEKDNIPFLIEGDKGIGKTMVVHEACADLDCPLITHSCSSGTTMGDILGRLQLQGDVSVFQLGVLPIAIEVANHYGRAVLYLDELSSLEPEIQKMLNPVLDDRHKIIVNDNLYKLKDEATLTVLATTNPADYQGSNPLNEDLRSRFIGEIWSYPKAIEVTKVIDWTDIPVDAVKKPLLTLATDTLSLRQEGEVDYVLSIRDIHLFTKAYRMWKNSGITGIENILEKTIQTTILIKYEDSKQRDLIRKRAIETFGVGKI